MAGVFLTDYYRIISCFNKGQLIVKKTEYFLNLERSLKISAKLFSHNNTECKSRNSLKSQEDLNFPAAFRTLLLVKGRRTASIKPFIAFDKFFPKLL